MSRKIDVYYDFTCPYCYQGLQEFDEILADYPDVEPVWHPCEAHPRPEFAEVHSDLAAQVLIYLQEHALDTKTFNDLVYKAHFEDKLRIDDTDLLADLASKAGAVREDVIDLLKENRNAKKVLDNNQKVWQDLAFDAVPSFVLEGKTAASKYLNLVSPEAIRALF